MEEENRESKDQTEQIFRNFFESCQPGSLHKTHWKNFPKKDGDHEKSGKNRITGKNQPGSDFSVDEKGGHEKRQAMQKPARNPQLGGQVGIVHAKDSHPFIGQEMKQVEDADEQVGDTDDQKRRIVQMMPGIPGDDENSRGNHDAEHFGKAVVEKIIGEADSIHRDKNQGA
jgi:hypothetical protein